MAKSHGLHLRPNAPSQDADITSLNTNRMIALEGLGNLVLTMVDRIKLRTIWKLL